MISIKLVPAEHGDCLFVHIEDDKPINILIDGGTRKTYRAHIRDEVSRIKEMNEQLDYVICTHMDDDHIGGLIELFMDEDNHVIKNALYNGFFQSISSKYYSASENKYTSRDEKILDEINDLGRLSGESQPISINDGVSLGVLIEEKGIPVNAMNDAAAITSNCQGKTVCIDNNTSIIFIGPSLEKLTRVEDFWKKKMIQKNFSFRVNNRIKLMKAFEFQMESLKEFYREEGCQVSEFDDLIKYAGELLEEDYSVTNNSSISFVLCHGKRKYLFLGDASIDEEILQALEEVVGEKYKFAAIKLPHHGSRYNISLEFLKRYSAEEYYCMTNSKKFKQHPDMETLATIICTNPDFKKIIFNYPIEKAIKIDSPEWKEKYNYDVILGDGITMVERKFE